MNNLQSHLLCRILNSRKFAGSIQRTHFCNRSKNGWASYLAWIQSLPTVHRQVPRTHPHRSKKPEDRKSPERIERPNGCSNLLDCSKTKQANSSFKIQRLKLNPSNSSRWPKTFANKCGFSWRPLRLAPRYPTRFLPPMTPGLLFRPGLSIHLGLLFRPGYQPGTTNRWRA